MDDASKKFQTGSSDGRAQERKEWERIRKLEAENAALRARVDELEKELWNCRQSLTPPQRPEDATYYPTPKNNTTYWDGDGVA
jgi:hypothetical protein